MVPSKRTYLKKSGVVSSSIDKRFNPTNPEEQDSSSSSDDLKTMTEVCCFLFIECKERRRAMRPLDKQNNTAVEGKWVDDDSVSSRVMSVAVDN